MISQQSQVIKTMQDENKSLQKKQIQIAQTNQALRESQTNLTAEINFLKEQVTVLWQNSTDDRHNTNPAIQRPETSTTSEGTMPNIASENRPENREPQATETGTPSQLITPNIPTGNRFLPLQDGKESPHVKESKRVADSGFHTMDSGFRMLDSGFHAYGFRIPSYLRAIF